MTRYAFQVFQVTGFNEALSTADTHAITRVLRMGGLCVIPSDTCYAIAADPLRKGLPEVINTVLQRHNTAISLSFGSQRMLERYVRLGYADLRVLDASSRQEPLTLVAPVRPDAHELLRTSLPAALGGDPGHLGVRLSFSMVERQIASEYDKPLTTAAIYYDDGSPMRDFSDALDYVVTRLDQTGQTAALAAVRHPTVKSGGVSTVVGFKKPSADGQGMTVYREGATSTKRLQNIAGRVTPRDVEDWT